MSFQENYIINVVLRGNAAAYKTLTQGLAGLATAAFTADVALAGLAVSAAKDISTYSKMGMAIGLTTQEAREMAAVFAAAGIEVDGVADLLGQLAGKAQDARDGNQGWIDDFKKLGITTEELRKAKPDQLFTMVADGIQNMSDATTRAAFADKLFGGEAKKLLPVLIHGSEGIKALRKESRLYSGVVTEDAAKASLKLTGDLRKMGMAVDSITTRLGAALVPIVGRITGKMIDWIEKNEDWLNLKVDQSINLLTRAFEALISPLGLAVTGIGGLVAIKQAIPTITALSAALKGLAASAGLAEMSIMPILGPAGIVAGVILILEDLYQAATGGKSVFADLAGYFGAESEFRAALAAIGDLFTSVAGTIWAVDKAIYSLLPSIKDILSYIPGLSQFIELFQKAWAYLPNMPSLKTVLGETAAQIEQGASVFKAATNAIDGRVEANRPLQQSPIDLDQKVYVPTTVSRAQAMSAVKPIQQVSIVVNATGLDEAAATRLAQKVVQSEILGAQDSASQGVR